MLAKGGVEYSGFTLAFFLFLRKQEMENFIPDSPIQSVSLSVVNRMRRKRENRHVRYTEEKGAPVEQAGRAKGKP